MVAPRLSTLFQPNSQSIPVIHPAFKDLGRVWIPVEYVLHTNGVDRYYSNHPHPPSLCMLYQQGRCNASSRCNQLHIQRDYMAAIAELLSSTPSGNCCYTHGDIASCREDFRFLLQSASRVEVQVEGLGSLVVPPNRIAVTTYWDRQLKNNKEAYGRVLSFSSKRVCNLHQARQCKYGVDCKNVHLCRDIWNNVLRHTGNAAENQDLIINEQPPAAINVSSKIESRSPSPHLEPKKESSEKSATAPLSSIIASMAHNTPPAQRVAKRPPRPIPDVPKTPPPTPSIKSPEPIHRPEAASPRKTKDEKKLMSCASAAAAVLATSTLIKSSEESSSPRKIISDTPLLCRVEDLSLDSYLCTGEKTDLCFGLDSWSPLSLDNFWADTDDKVSTHNGTHKNSMMMPLKPENINQYDESRRLQTYLLRGISPSPPPRCEPDFSFADNAICGSGKLTNDTEKWNIKTEASREKIKKIKNLAGLPSVQTRGPNCCPGFAMGRGMPCRE